MPSVTFVINMEFKNRNDGWMATNLGLAAAGSEQESVFRTENGGTSWIKIASTPMKWTPNTLSIGGDKSGVSFLNEQRGWATGTTYVFGHAYLYETRNGGGTWQPQELSIPHALKDAQISTYPPTFFTTKDGVLPVQAVLQPSSRSEFIVYRTANGGNSWWPMTPMRGASNAWDLETLNRWDIFVNGNRLNVTPNGGRNWHTMHANIQASNIVDFEFTSANQGWALMNSGLLYETEDGGSQWSRTASVKRVTLDSASRRHG